MLVEVCVKYRGPRLFITTLTSSGICVKLWFKLSDQGLPSAIQQIFGLIRQRIDHPRLFRAYYPIIRDEVIPQHFIDHESA